MTTASDSGRDGRRGTRMNRRGFAALCAALLASRALPLAAQEKVVRVDTIRSPSYEILLKRMGGAVPGTKVVPTMLTVDKLTELLTIRLSSKSDALDLMYMNDGLLRQFAKNGWLQPIDDLVPQLGKLRSLRAVQFQNTHIFQGSYTGREPPRPPLVTSIESIRRFTAAERPTSFRRDAKTTTRKRCLTNPFTR